MNTGKTGGLPTKRGTGSRLYAAVGVTLIVITAFGSATFAQQSQSWHGQLDLSALTPVYRNLAQLDVVVYYRGPDRGQNLFGVMKGEVTAEKSGGIPCTIKVSRPARLYAVLLGRYTRETNTMSLKLEDQNVVMGSLSCPPVPGVIEFGHGLIDQPVLEQLLSNLTIKADGSVEATREDTSVPQNTVRVKLTLGPAYCGGGPHGGAVFAQSTTGASVTIYSEPSPNSSRLVSAPNGMRLIYRQTKQVGGQTWFYVTPPARPAGWVIDKDLSCHRPGEPIPTPQRGPPDTGERPTASQVAGARG